MKRFAWLISALAACVLVATPVRAQTPNDAEQRAAIKELLEVMNFKQIVKQMNDGMRLQLPQMLSSMADAAAKGSQLSPEKKAEAMRFAREMQDKAMDRMSAVFNDPEVIRAMEESMARSYARHFTTDEIRATAAFYRSPAGAKALNLMPKIMQETMPELMNVISPRMQVIMEELTKDAITRAQGVPTSKK